MGHTKYKLHGLILLLCFTISTRFYGNNYDWTYLQSLGFKLQGQKATAPPDSYIEYPTGASAVLYVPAVNQYGQQYQQEIVPVLLGEELMIQVRGALYQLIVPQPVPQPTHLTHLTHQQPAYPWHQQPSELMPHQQVLMTEPAPLLPPPQVTSAILAQFQAVQMSERFLKTQLKEKEKHVADLQRQLRELKQSTEESQPDSEPEESEKKKLEDENAHLKSSKQILTNKVNLVTKERDRLKEERDSLTWTSVTREKKIEEQKTTLNAVSTELGKRTEELKELREELDQTKTFVHGMPEQLEKELKNINQKIASRQREAHSIQFWEKKDLERKLEELQATPLRPDIIESHTPRTSTPTCPASREIGIQTKTLQPSEAGNSDNGRTDMTPKQASRMAKQDTEIASLKKQIKSLQKTIADMEKTLLEAHKSEGADQRKTEKINENGGKRGKGKSKEKKKGAICPLPSHEASGAAKSTPESAITAKDSDLGPSKAVRIDPSEYTPVAAFPGIPLATPKARGQSQQKKSSSKKQSGGANNSPNKASPPDDLTHAIKRTGELLASIRSNAATEIDWAELNGLDFIRKRHTDSEEAVKLGKQMYSLYVTIANGNDVADINGKRAITWIIAFAHEKRELELLVSIVRRLDEKKAVPSFVRSALAEQWNVFEHAFTYVPHSMDSELSFVAIEMTLYMATLALIADHPERVPLILAFLPGNSDFVTVIDAQLSAPCTVGQINQGKPFILSIQRFWKWLLIVVQKQYSHWVDEDKQNLKAALEAMNVYFKKARENLELVQLIDCHQLTSEPSWDSAELQIADIDLDMDSTAWQSMLSRLDSQATKSEEGVPDDEINISELAQSLITQLQMIHKQPSPRKSDLDPDGRFLRLGLTPARTPKDGHCLFHAVLEASNPGIETVTDAEDYIDSFIQGLIGQAYSMHQDDNALMTLQAALSHSHTTVDELVSQLLAAQNLQNPGDQSAWGGGELLWLIVQYLNKPILLILSEGTVDGTTNPHIALYFQPGATAPLTLTEEEAQVYMLPGVLFIGFSPGHPGNGEGNHWFSATHSSSAQEDLSEQAQACPDQLPGSPPPPYSEPGTGTACTTLGSISFLPSSGETTGITIQIDGKIITLF